MTISDLPILTIVTFTPLVGALIIAFAPSRYARSLALAASLVAWVVSLLLLVGFNPDPPDGRPFRGSRIAIAATDFLQALETSRRLVEQHVGRQRIAGKLITHSIGEQDADRPQTSLA